MLFSFFICHAYTNTNTFAKYLFYSLISILLLKCIY